jgi:predicted N-formylglutamate amidohydrolase
MVELLRSRAGVCDVEFVRGSAARPDAPPDLFLEVAHGATRAAHFTELRQSLRGDYPADLQDFFFVNTDVGAPELAAAVAHRVVRSQPRKTAVVVRCLVPRTFVDCNRKIERDAVATASRAGEMTPGLQPWVRDPHDRELLLARYFAYREVVTAAFDATATTGGLALFVHTYAPRSIDVAVDLDIGKNLRAAYAADRIGTWTLRPAIDLITHDPDGRELAAPKLAARAAAEFTAAGFEVERNATYPLHPVTLAHTFASQRPQATLCLEVRRDLLLAEFVPFRELIPDAPRVERAAAPLAAAVLGEWR